MTNATVSDATDKASDAARGASEVAGTARQQAGNVAHAGREEARSVALEASSQARRLLSDSSEELRTQANAQSARVSEGLHQISRQLQQMAGAAEDQNSAVVNIVGQASATTRELAERLDRGGVEGLIDDTRRFARNRPGLFLAGAVGAGFVMGRLLKGASAVSGGPAAKERSASPATADVAALPPRSTGGGYGEQGITGGYSDPAVASGTGTVVTGTPGTVVPPAGLPSTPITRESRPGGGALNHG